MFHSRVFLLLAFLCLLVACMSAPALAGDDVSPVESLLPESSRLCGQCHEAVYASFQGNVHARLRSFEFRGTPGGCESCHGPGAKHMDSGNPSDIYQFGEKESETDNLQCLRCHRTDSFANWYHGEHARNGVACVDCHDIHKGKGKAPKDQMTLCAKCHSDVKAQMYYPSHHPVREGKMECTSCHNPHGDSAAGDLRTSERRNDLCLTCHTRYQGPFIFEHAPVVEDCMICHNPHGTAANNLLKQNEPFLCLQCHTAHFHTAREGETMARTSPAGSVDNRWGEAGFARAFGTRCTQCHNQIHGSDLPSQATSSQGGNLTR